MHQFAVDRDNSNKTTRPVQASRNLLCRSPSPSLRGSNDASAASGPAVERVTFGSQGLSVSALTLVSPNRTHSPRSM